jgi:hypothetical protein
MTESADQRPVEEVDQALAAAHREERDEREQARRRDQELADRLAEALSRGRIQSGEQ